MERTLEEKLKEEIEKAMKILRKITLSSDYGCQDQSSGFYFRDIAFEAEKVLTLREDESEECRGRLTGDKGRFKVGLQVGRLFGVKTGQKAGEWIPIEAYFKDEKVLEG